MGVLGLTPFLAKHCPDVLKELPNGIKAISGKTIVIDATLLTQRFHFGGGVRNRHVSGWYRFITNLKASNVNAICVFDGKERNSAKARELQRRRETRATSVARENLEVERLDRLTNLQKLVRKVRSLPAKQQGAITDELRPVIKVETSLPPPTLPLEETEQSPEVEVVEQAGQEQPVAALEETLPSEKPPALEDSQTSEPKVPSSPVPESPTEQVSRELVPEADIPTKKLATKLVKSYKKYSDSLPNFAKLQIAVSAIPLTSSSTQTPEPIDPDPEFYAAASRLQYQLALKEGQAWSKLVEEQPSAVHDAEDEFQDLQERSQLLTNTYQRRNDFPTAQTYEDVKSLLVAMGVPCVQSEAPYEGEGLASAIVLAGHADFVVSEDTDVIVYGAPLLRGVTDRKRPIMEIDSREVLKALSLSRERFVDFALLTGTDFTPRLKNVGPVRALKFIREHGSIEEIVKTETKYLPQLNLPEYLVQVQLGREIFRALPPVPSPDKLRQLPPDEAGVQAVVERFGLSTEMLTGEGEDFFAAGLKGNYFGDNPHQD